VAAAAAFAIATATPGAGPPAGVAQVTPVPATPETVVAGAELYRKYCRECHGPAGAGGIGDEGGPRPADLSDARWDHGGTDADIATVIRDGLGPDYYMPRFKDRLSEVDIWSVVHFVQTLAKTGAPQTAQ